MYFTFYFAFVPAPAHSGPIHPVLPEVFPYSIKFRILHSSRPPGVQALRGDCRPLRGPERHRALLPAGVSWRRGARADDWPAILSLGHPGDARVSRQQGRRDVPDMPTDEVRLRGGRQGGVQGGHAAVQVGAAQGHRDFRLRAGAHHR